MRPNCGFIRSENIGPCQARKVFVVADEMGAVEGVGSAKQEEAEILVVSGPVSVNHTARRMSVSGYR